MMVSNCVFRTGYADRSGVYFVCKLAPFEKYPVSEMIDICSNFCPLRGRDVE